MMIAEADHKRWVLAINKFIDTPNGTAPKPESNYHKCRFGLWYYELIERHQAGEAQAGHTQAIERLKIDLDRASGTLTDYIQLIQAEILISAQTAKR